MRECKKTPDHQKQDVSTILIEKLIKLTIKKVKILEKSLKFKFLVMNKLSRRRAIRTRLKPLKIGFFFVVGFDIPCIIKTFRLEKSQF